MCFHRQSVLDDDPDPPTVPNDPNLPNILVLSGGSVIDLIAGEPIARDATARSTRKMASYRIQLRDASKVVPVTLYDVPGFDYNARSPLEFPRVPISLAVICLEDVPAQVKATADYLKNRWPRHADRNVPMLVVVNHVAPTPDPGWWEENKKHFPSLGVVTDHVCLTKQKKQESTKRLHSFIIQHLSAHKTHRRTRAL